MGWKASDIPDQSGKVAVVTGGNGGLGLETARQLAAHGAHVVIGARNLAKAEAAIDEIESKVPGASLEILGLDLGSLASIAEFAAAVKAAHPTIDLLINNAGLMAVPEGKTADGFETQFGTNQLGHFALTMHMLPALLAAPSPRVVNITSTARFQAGKYDLSNPHMHGCYDPWEAYGMSKRANLQFAFELNRRLKDRGLAAFAADPGFSKTDLQSASARANNGFLQRFWRTAVALTGQPAAMGALPQLRAGTDPDAVGGTLYAPRWITFGAPIVRGVGKRINNPAQMVQLWDLCERETGLALEAALKKSPTVGAGCVSGFNRARNRGSRSSVVHDLLMEPIAFGLGILLVVLVAWDLFQTIVVPRPSPSRFRIARYLVRGCWRMVRMIGRGRNGEPHDTLLGLFAPAMTLALLIVWIGALILGYGLILFAVRDQLGPSPQDLGTTMYFAASSILTLGFGDVVAVGPAARGVVIVAAISGLGSVALAVTYLFSLYGSYQRREVLVVALQAAAGAPPSAVTLLETYAEFDLVDRLPGLFAEWERWAAEVLDTHVAYPLLGFFRSSHDNLSWISALGTVLDAASLVLTTIRGVPRGEAELFRRVGTHLAEDITNLGFQAGVTERPDPVGSRTGLGRAAFDAACVRLARAGYDLAPGDGAWQEFEVARAAYSGRLEAMAAFWITPTNSWLEPEASLRSPVHPPSDTPSDALDRGGYPPT